MKAFFVAAFVVMTASASILQQPSAAKSSVEVTVVRAGTGEPIPGARVVIGPTSAPVPPGSEMLTANSLRPASCNSGSATIASGSTFVADNQGKYVFRDLSPGWYCIVAGANGYSKAVYGQKTATGVGTPVNLTSGQFSNGILIPLLPAGAITGMVRDSSGQPATGIQVQVFQVTYNANGQRVFQSAGSGRSDDRGDYRLYWITPGRYVVMASSSITMGSAFSSPNEMPAAPLVPMFYPNVFDASQATSIVVRPGAEISGVDFFLPQQASYRIRGRVVDGRNGQVPGSVNITIVTMTATASNTLTSTQFYNPQDGSFDLSSVSPGPHAIRAQVNIGSSTVTPETGGLISSLAAGSATGQVALNVTSDINGLVLTIVNGAAVPGRLSWEGQASSSTSGLDKIRVQLRPSIDGVISNIGGPAPVTQATSPDGVFRIDTVLPGEYRLVVSPLPPDAYVKQARFNQFDALAGPLQIGLPVGGTLDVVLSTRGGQIDGSVTDDRQQVARDLQVVLIPDRQRDRIDLYRTATTDSSGRFSIRGIAPGDYRLFAWEAIEPFSYFDPELLRQDEQKGKAVHIAESSKESVNLKSIPAHE